MQKNYESRRAKERLRLAEIRLIRFLLSSLRLRKLLRYEMVMELPYTNSYDHLDHSLSADRQACDHKLKIVNT
ncbi:MAG: hypothetical protein JST43_04040 [Bacteroidetes bacterium]|nr:hypothetical protein [Bacteroidota bacterium]MBS1541117.1 hypothetical protein [Bacteroidota bacterium]